VSWKPYTYGSQYGWKAEERHWYGHKFISMRAFEPSPHSIGNIHFGPNHVRAWTVEAYKKAGKHNPDYRVLDDQDLVSRTYLTTKMKHIPECLYLYRNYPEQSFRRFNQEIQSGTLKLYDKYIFDMAKRWCQLNNYPMVDLGAKHGKPLGFFGVDLYGTDITVDLNQEWPFKDSSVGLIRANDIIEHLKDPVNTMNEAYRILVDGGWFLIEVPSTDGRGTYQDPSHRCYSQDTEILTTSGFKLLSEVKKGETVYTFNKTNNKAEIQPVIKTHKYKYNSPMIHFKQRSIDCLVTPNHNMFIGSSDDITPFRFKKAEKLLTMKSCKRIPSNVIFDGDYPEYFEIPNSQNKISTYPEKMRFINDSVRLPIKPFMDFMGWYVSEGWTHIVTTTDSRYNCYNIGISQSQNANPIKYQQIGQCIKDLGYKPHKTSNGWGFCSKSLALWLSKLGKSHDKYIPIALKQMHPELLQILLESALLGDGHKNGKTGYTYGTISEQLSKDIQEIAIKCGYKTTVSKDATRVGKPVSINPDYRAKYPIYLVYLSSPKQRYLTPDNIKQIDYRGMVYCVTVPKNNVILTRRNGRVIWAGNSFWNSNSFWYYTDRKYAKYVPAIKCRFQVQRILNYNPTEFHKQNYICYTRAHLTAIKNKRYPGTIKI